jgi:hypothetical protein
LELWTDLWLKGTFGKFLLFFAGPGLGFNVLTLDNFVLTLVVELVNARIGADWLGDTLASILGLW